MSGPYFDDDGYGWGDDDMNDDGSGYNDRGDYRNRHYRNAYGNYRGGYGPDGGYGPPPGFGPGGFGPGPGMGPRPHFSWGRGFGPRGPPGRKFTDNKTLRFLIRLGVPKENFKNLPKALLHLIKPQFCGLCATNLESMAVSRMHYVSKNHMKNQKKWLTQHSDMGYHRKETQIPMKARELYCEICDVHITSKTHAESHYAGKPHRAIVEGRKIPRNPFLLQKGMEGRLEMLIRREKKFIKPEEIDAQQQQALEEAKAVQPDLFCDICKTTVTCSEQMTMHLNGKRHLNKEKQHILKMMKGPKEDSVDDENEEEDNEEGEEEEEEGYGEGDGEKSAADEEGGEQADSTEKKEEDNYDWGNGSGNWDEPTTN